MFGSGAVSRTAVFVLLFWSTRASGAPGSCRTLTRHNVVACATDASPTVASAVHAAAAAEGRVVAARPLLPSRPTLGLSAGRATRSSAGAALAWRAELAQELELAGQRGARIKAARSEAAAQKHAAAAASREVATGALLLYFEALAAEEEARLERRAERVAQRVERAVAALAEQGGAARIDADLAAASSARATQARLEAERRARSARTALASYVGRVEVAVVGELHPVPRPRVAANDPTELPEVLALRALQSAERERAEALRRQRVPNLTLSLFAERDGYDEQVLGVGVLLPLPLPNSVARSYDGEIREAEALARRASSQAEERVRKATLDLTLSLDDYDAREKALRTFQPERLARAERSLDDMATEIEQQRLAAREAIVAQQALLDYLRAHLAARYALCRASVELLRASGQPLQGGER